MKKFIIAHRGASDLAPENTLAAFKKAIEIGADMIELDVRKTKDNVLVVAHDSVYRSKTIGSLSFRELSEFSQNQTPSLKEVLDLCRGKIMLNVELKEGGYEGLAGETLLKNFEAGKLVVTSFDSKTLIDLKRLYPQLNTGLIVGTYFGQWGKILKLIFNRKFSRQFEDLSLNYKYWQSGLYKLLPLKNHRVWVWTADNPETIRKLLLRPEVSGIITNKPGVAIKIYKDANSK